VPKNNAAREMFPPLDMVNSKWNESYCNPCASEEKYFLELPFIIFRNSGDFIFIFFCYFGQSGERQQALTGQGRYNPPAAGLPGIGTLPGGGFHGYRARTGGMDSDC
jgi:hypothetical protein